MLHVGAGVYLSYNDIGVNLMLHIGAAGQGYNRIL